MSDLQRILWIEDGARTEYHDLLTPIHVAGYDLTIARDATDGVKYLLKRLFDAVIIDIRLPPGLDPRWINIYNEHGANPAAAQLGMEIIRSIFSPTNSSIAIERPDWLTAKRCAVFSVDADQKLIKDELEDLKIRSLVKSSGGSRLRILKLIQEMLGIDNLP